MLSLSSYHVYTDRNYEKVCEACHITLNKCAIYGSISSGGVRIGTPAMTSRGCVEDDFEAIADFLFRAAQITSIIQREHAVEQAAAAAEDIFLPTA
ncbi:serine hydroxymethyltransferase 1-like protein [Trifolium pratense]|uniref:Serine hydroxymethyltransferase 1-like protein n=1 Tax=Trifolium pratense TaxID=57577 RepID=A0A2K3PQ41_TRIPR|nr:serine hydroxymethyltransferase 1-like protein [Trifolium pratense]